jgi:hypothetical protein
MWIISKPWPSEGHLLLTTVTAMTRWINAIALVALVVGAASAPLTPHLTPHLISTPVSTGCTEA